MLTRRSMPPHARRNDTQRAAPHRAGVPRSPRVAERLDGTARADTTAQRVASSRAGTSSLLTLALLSGDTDARDELARWATRAGLDIGAPLRVALVTSTAAVASEQLAAGVREQLGISRPQPPLVTTLGDQVAAVRPADEPAALVDEWRGVAGALATRFHAVRVAIGGSGTWPTGLRASLEQARCLVALQRDGSALSALPDIVVFETAGLISALLGACGGRDLVGFAHRVLHPLLENDRCGGELLETLHAYLGSAGSTGRAAKQLHLHPSSVKYRLKVIRQLIGRDRLDDPNSRFELELAVRIITAVRQLAAPPTDASGLRRVVSG